jgi:hypothetical protein
LRQQADTSIPGSHSATTYEVDKPVKAVNSARSVF